MNNEQTTVHMTAAQAPSCSEPSQPGAAGAVAGDPEWDAYCSCFGLEPGARRETKHVLLFDVWQRAVAHMRGRTRGGAATGEALPQRGETWHVRCSGGRTLWTVVVAEVTARTVLVRDSARPNSGVERYPLDELQFVERVTDSTGGREP